VDVQPQRHAFTLEARDFLRRVESRRRVRRRQIFIARLDGKLIALDAETGKVAWSVAAADYKHRETETMAPQFVDGKVLVGVSGGELEVRGFLTAFDAKTGRREWRFYTIPGAGKPGNATWAGDSWKTDGAPVWQTPNVDPKLGLVYVNTGNAAPDLNGSKRAGKNLYSASVVAVDLNTGEERWYFQEVHHDLWDYDGIQPTQLFDVEKNGSTIPAIGHANKDGYYFILDRRTGKPVSPVNEVSVPTSPAWQHAYPTQPESAISLEPHTVGHVPSSVKPQYAQSAPQFTPPHRTAILMQPGFETGPEWAPGAYSPRTKYVYLPAGGYEPWLYVAKPNDVVSMGSSGTGAKAMGLTYGLFDAVDTQTERIAWTMRIPEKSESGVVVAGDLVFFGQSDGNFDALDSKSGKSLWSWHGTSMPGVGSPNGAGAAYVVNGREYVVMAFGGNLRDRADAPGKGGSKQGDTLIAFALPQNGLAAGPHVVNGTRNRSRSVSRA